MVVFVRSPRTIFDGAPHTEAYRGVLPAMGGAQLSSCEVSSVAAYVWALSHRSGRRVSVRRLRMSKTDVNGQEAASGTVSVALHINGAEHHLRLEPRVSLLDALREHVGLTGTKKGCNQGACGACTVLVDGERINSCLALAVQYEGRAILTIEGVGGDRIHPMQTAFVDHDGLQCGYCTPGQICSAIAMLAEIRDGMPSAVTTHIAAREIELTEAELKERMSGNLCRCGAYVGIVGAIRQVFESEVRR
jgi:xanthine dehydrogenase YagT iron-sulfur-binding subunit